MPVDPQIQALLDMGTGVPATNKLSVPEARAQYEGRIRLMAPPATVGTVTERSIAGPGGDLRLRIYRPVGRGAFPLLAFFHGSGFVLCSLDTHDGMCRNLCAGAGCVVVSVDYRLAPEHKYPAGLDDCVAATRWIADHASELDGDVNRLAICGDSAGGNLAAAAALRLRDEGGPHVMGQLLIYPVTDYHTPGTPSYRENADGYGLTRDTMVWFWDHYLTDPSEAADPLVSPLRAANLSGLPPAAQRRLHAISQRPDGNNTASIMAFSDTRAASEESALYGTPDEIARKIEKLRDMGVEYILLNGGGTSRENLRRFAKEVMPAFHTEPEMRAAG
jgi:acetyl esterase